ALDGVPLVLPVADPRPWSPASPFLYGLRLEVVDASGKVVDAVRSYAGLRKVHIEGDRFFLNNEPLYFSLVLDQGFYPDGIWTAPSDEALRRDIELSIAAGFNGARLHQKVFEERFHYWADKLGYLTWGESSSWGIDVNRVLDARNFLSEWAEIVVRDRNHPSIIAWSPFNETGNVTDAYQHHRVQIDAYNLCKAIDPTRPVNDASGYVHALTDLWTVHDYARAEKLVELDQGPGKAWTGHPEPHKRQCPYQGQPYINDEFGGLKWIPADRRPFADNTWGYGADIPDLEAFYKLLSDEVDVMLRVSNLSGWCYTQLTDVEQEQNGIYCYDRTPKFDMARIREIFSRRTPSS
ncbi:MAG: beta-glucuronidase, partial [Kiritimatiellae bacterium]|nr:beta-glucuronidase [Kiritimatiellia bacterium]